MARFLILLGAGLAAACTAATDSAPATNQAGQASAPSAEMAEDGRPFRVTPVADFTAPWAMTFLPDGRMLVTEKAGQMMLVSADGQSRTALSGIPAVDSAGQGGLMDVVLHPDFAANRMVYFSFSETGAGGKGVALARGVLSDGAQPGLTGVEVIFRASPYVEGNGHYSGRIAFSPDGSSPTAIGRSSRPHRTSPRRWARCCA